MRTTCCTGFVFEDPYIKLDVKLVFVETLLGPDRLVLGIDETDVTCS